jgi:hypothetical protein
VTLSGLKDDAGAYVNDATVTAVMKDKDGIVVTNASSVTFTYVAASSGVYEAILPYNIDTLDGREYTLFITAVAGIRRAQLTMKRKAAYIEI